jgi:PAS domain S-box-containing protein
MTPPEWESLDNRSYQEVLQTGKHLPFEKQFWHKDGRRIDVIVGGEAFFDTGQRGFSFVVDIRESKQAQRALEAASAEREAILNQLTEGVIVTDPHGKITYVNEAAQRIHGMAQLAVTPDQYTETYGLTLENGEPYPPEALPLTRAVKQEEVVLDEHWCIVQPDGTKILAIGSASPVYGKNGRKMGAVLTVRDDTQRKLAEEALKESEARYQTLYQWEKKTLEIVEALREAQEPVEMLNCLIQSLGEVLQVSRVYLLEFNDAKEGLPVRFEYRSQPDLSSIKDQIPPWQQCPLIQKALKMQSAYVGNINDGDCLKDNSVMQAFVEEKNVLGALASPIIYQNELLAVVGIHTMQPRHWSQQELSLVQTACNQAAISIYQAQALAARNAAEALKEDFQHKYEWEKRVRETIQSLRQVLEPDQIFPLLVEQVGQTLGLDRMFVIEFNNGDPLPVRYQFTKDPTVDSFMGFVPPWHECPYFKCCQGKQSVFISDVHRCEIIDDKWRTWFSQQGMNAYAAIPIFYQDEVLNTMVLHSSHTREWNEFERSYLAMIAEQLAIALYQARAKAELEAVSRRKSEFVAMMSHELRTPLNAILGYSRMLETGMAGPMNDKQVKFAHNVSISGQHLLNIINDLLDVSKIEAGKMMITPEWLVLAPVLSEVQSMMIELAHKKNVQLTFDIAPDIDWVFVDPGRFRQILINLISNAIKFNRDHGRVTFRLFCQNHELVGEIADNGIGIPKHKHHELFKKFQQLDTSAARAQEGTGLGLALTKDLLEMHGGSITVHSEEGVGSVFRFTLPAPPRSMTQDGFPNSPLTHYVLPTPRSQ